jgi:hypothetical protein
MTRGDQASPLANRKEGPRAGMPSLFLVSAAAAHCRKINFAKQLRRSWIICAYSELRCGSPFKAASDRPKFSRRSRAQRDSRSEKGQQQQTAAEDHRARDRLLFGSLGAASPARRIDPRTGDISRCRLIAHERSQCSVSVYRRYGNRSGWCCRNQFCLR